MSDQKSTLHSPADLGSPTPTEPGADGSFPPTATAEMTSRSKVPAPPGLKTANLLEVDRLVKYFPVRGGLMQRTVAWVKAVDDVSFFIRRGETLGLVGESGCGKTTVGRTVLRLLPATSGKVLFEGKDIFQYKPEELKRLRRDIQIIFQD